MHVSDQAPGPSEGQRRYFDEYRRALLHEKMLERELAGIKGGIVWKLMDRFQGRFIDRFMPRGSRLRSCYGLALKSGRILIAEGPAGLWKRYHGRREVARKEKEAPGAAGKRGPARKYRVTRWSGQKLAFPAYSKPAVSIVIPVHNNVDHTYSCLKSVLENTGGPYEVIVVDDASGDGTPALLEGIENITVARNDACAGFIGSCNRGAGLGRADYLLFLNNDTIVTEGWLRPLLDIMALDVGAVGSKLIYPDGRLQEAGGIIRSDASGHNYGRGDDPERPEYNFVREADYCSGASLLVRKELFDRLGGFDVRFRPGYYEDADLCFSIRRLGLKVLYQPASVVVHFEGATGIGSGAKRHRQINKEKFLMKWGEVLGREHHGPATDPWLARDRRSGQRILVIDHYVPMPDRDAGSARMYNLLKILSELGHRVTFLGESTKRYEPYTSALQQAAVEVAYAPYWKSVGEYLKAHGGRFDTVIVSRLHIAARYMLDVKTYCPDAGLIFDTVDLQFLRERRRAGVEGSPALLAEAEKLKRSELAIATLSDVTLTVSDVEKEVLAGESPLLDVEVVSLVHEVRENVRPFAERSGLMFLGSFQHLPNVDAALWLSREIFPLIRSEVPGIKLYIIGDRPPDEVRSLGSRDVIVTGYVPDLTPYFDRCRVFVAPLRYGAGVKGKINESMGHGLPVVTTRIGAEGMGLEDGENALIADDPAAFAGKVARLYGDEGLWNALSRRSRENVRAKFSREVARKSLERVVGRMPRKPGP